MWMRVWSGSLFHGINAQLPAIQPDLHGLAAQLAGNLVEHLVVAGDRDQFGMEFAAEDACLFVALRAGQRAPAQRAVDVDGAVGDDLRACAHGGDHGRSEEHTSELQSLMRTSY